NLTSVPGKLVETPNLNAFNLNDFSSTSHSLRYFYTAVSEPGQGLPQFIAVGYVDDQPFVQYDSDTKQYLSQVPWMKKAEMEDPQYQERNNRNFQGDELGFRVDLQILQNRYNQSGGIHTFQWMYGCELRSDGRKGGHFQFGYDGRDFIAFDKETLTWTAADTGAQVTKRKWDPIMALNQGRKHYLEETCIEWLGGSGEGRGDSGAVSLQAPPPPLQSSFLDQTANTFLGGGGRNMFGPLGGETGSLQSMFGGRDA
uniref:MHC class I-like antigen recognition-like domain-containing protein n=1 Tax=Podarcis muralis TaxID=64176 RepID=A0A670HLB1_PODMU